MASIGSVMTFGMNKILIAFTSTASAVFGVYFKLQSFIFMPVFGLNNGMVPIVAYNYGAAKPDRIIKTIKLSVIYAVSIMLIGFAVFQLFPDRLLAIFNASDNMLEIGIPALRIISLSFLLAGFCISALPSVQALCPRHVEPLDFRSETACGAASRGIHPFQGGRTFGHLVRVPDCRGLLRCYFIAVSAVRL